LPFLKYLYCLSRLSNSPAQAQRSVQNDIVCFYQACGSLTLFRVDDAIATSRKRHFLKHGKHNVNVCRKILTFRFIGAVAAENGISCPRGGAVKENKILPTSQFDVYANVKIL
jgi:hypothetical protein